MTAKNYETYTVPDSEVEKLMERLAKAEVLLELSAPYVTSSSCISHVKIRTDEIYKKIKEFLTSNDAGEKTTKGVE